MTKLKEQEIALALAMVATSPIEREFWGINWRTGVGTRLSDESVDAVARFLEEVRLNRIRLEFYS